MIPDYKERIYPLTNKSKKGVQHYGYIISNEGLDIIRQWHKPVVQGHVFMTESEAHSEALTTIDMLLAGDEKVPEQSPFEINRELTKQIMDLQTELKKYKKG